MLSKGGMLISKKGIVDLKWETFDPSTIGFCSIITMMTKSNPKERPSALAVHSYHSFWSEAEATNFIKTVGNLLDDVPPRTNLEAGSTRIGKYSFQWPCPSATIAEFGMKNSKNTCWGDALCETIRDHTLFKNNKRRNYDTKDASHLLRYIRNLHLHHHTQPEKVQKALGSKSDFPKYWFSRFPLLVDIVFLAFRDATKESAELSSFYPPVNEYKPGPDIYSGL